MSIVGSIKPDTSLGTRLAELSLRADEQLLPAAADLVSNIARTRGIKEKNTKRLNQVLLEVCKNVIKYGYENDSSRFIDVKIEERSHSLVIAVEDQGVPFDYQPLEKGEDTRFTSILAHEYADAIHFKSLGNKGNRVELVRNLPMQDIREDLPSEPTKEDPKQKASDPDENLTIRIMRPDETRELAKVVYRCYDYSYACNFVYFPERVESRLRSGLMVSMAAFNTQNEMVGHLALSFHRQGARVAEAGQAVVDPRYRGHGLFKTMKNKFKEYAATHEIKGIYSEAVTAHPYSQKGNLALGAREIGFLLGYSPGTVSFRSIEDSCSQKRRSIAFMYLPVLDSPEIPVYLPEEYLYSGKKIYKNIGIKRSMPNPQKTPETLPPNGALHMTLRNDHHQAFIIIDSIGKDTPVVINARKRQLFKSGIQCIYIDLPLNIPESAWLGSELRQQGFFFGSIIPEYESSDVLRMQQLNNLEIEPEEIHVASEFGQELLDMILEDMENVEESTQGL